MITFNTRVVIADRVSHSEAKRHVDLLQQLGLDSQKEDKLPIDEYIQITKNSPSTFLSVSVSVLCLRIYQDLDEGIGSRHRISTDSLIIK